MSKGEQSDLLQSLQMDEEDLEFDFPSVYVTPDGRVIWDFHNGHSDRPDATEPEPAQGNSRRLFGFSRA